MDPKERKEFIDDMSQSFSSALTLDRKKNGYVSGAVCKRTHEELNKSVTGLTESIHGLNEGVDRQSRTTTKLAQIVDRHLTEADVTLTVEEKAAREKEKSEEKEARVKSEKLKKFVAWAKIISIVVALLGSLLGGAYALGSMEERIMSQIEKNKVNP